MKLSKLLTHLGVTAESHLTDTPPPWGNDAGTMRSWSVTLRRDSAEVTVDFFTGLGIESEPQVDDVVSCLIADRDSGMDSFGDFCEDMGLDEDSRKARAAWRQCRVNGRKVEHLLGNMLDEVIVTLSDNGS